MLFYFTLSIQEQQALMERVILGNIDEESVTLDDELFILHSIFEVYKSTNDSTSGIPANNLYPLLKTLGMNLSRDKYNFMISKYQTDVERVVPLEKFVKLLLDKFLIIKETDVSISIDIVILFYSLRTFSTF